MKKKLMLVVLSVVMALACVVGLAACGSKADGTYYMYMNGQIVEEGGSLTISGSEATYSVKAGGTSMTQEGKCKVDGDTVTVTFKEGGQSASMEFTIVSKGVLKADMGGTSVYYCQKGKTPPADEE